MAETITRTINWSELYDAVSLRSVIKEINSMTVQEVQIDKEYKFALLEGINRYTSNFESTFDLIPNEVIIEKNKSLTFINTILIELNNYSEILNFISLHTPYIDDFVKDQNIETVEIECRDNLTNYDTGSMHDKLSMISDIKDWLYKENNEELKPLVLAALIKRFYRQDLVPFKVKPTAVLARIKSNVSYVNSLLDENIDKLKNYIINFNMDNCVDMGASLTKFKFINNDLFTTPYFEMYRQNLDVKFLSHISQANLREQAETCRK